MASSLLLVLGAATLRAAPPTTRPARLVPAMFGVNLCGAEFGAGALPGTYGRDYIYPNGAELDYWKGRGVLLVRLPFRWERMQHELNAPLDPDELGRLDTFLAAARGRGVKVILDLHNFGRYREGLVGSPAVPNGALADFWEKLAGHCRGNPAVWGYGLMNEPHDTKGTWPAAAQAGVDGVRAADRDHYVLVAGDGWSNAHGWAANNPRLAVRDPAGRMLYEAHLYFDGDSSGTYTHGYDQEHLTAEVGAERVKPFLQWLREHNAQGFIGEFGVPDDDPRWCVALDRLLETLSDEGVGGTYWAAGPWWHDYRLSVESSEGKDRPQARTLICYARRKASAAATRSATRPVRTSETAR